MKPRVCARPDLVAEVEVPRISPGTGPEFVDADLRRMQPSMADGQVKHRPQARTHADREHVHENSSAE